MALWLDDPAVVAAGRESWLSHVEWNKATQTEQVLAGNATLEQRAIFNRVAEAEAAYKAAKHAAMSNGVTRQTTF